MEETDKSRGDTEENSNMIPFWILQSIETEEDRNLVEQLYNEYEQLLYTVAYSYLRDRSKAEDAVQDTFLKLIPHLEKISEIKCPQTKGYLVTIIKHVCLNVIGSKRNKTEISICSENNQNKEDYLIDSIPTRYDSTEDSYFEQYEISKLTCKLKLLPEISRNTLILYAVEGYSMREISELEETTIEAVKKRIQRARKQLTKMMDE